MLFTKTMIGAAGNRQGRANDFQVTKTERWYALVEELRAVSPRPRSAQWLANRFEVMVADGCPPVQRLTSSRGPAGGAA